MLNAGFFVPVAWSAVRYSSYLPGGRGRERGGRDKPRQADV